VTHQVFISYSTKNTTTASAVCEGLEENAIPCWIAPRDIAPGIAWAAAIDKAIGSSRVMVLILSSHANDSPQVIREVCAAVERGIEIIPVRIEEIIPSGAMKYYLSTVQWFDALTPPLDDHILRLVEGTNRILSRKEKLEEPRIQRAKLPLWTTSELSMIGREKEIGQLQAVWSKVHSGLAQIAFLSGDAGTGKTRLVQDFVTLQAGAGARWLASRRGASDLSPPYAALEQAVRPVIEQGIIPEISPEFLSEIAQSIPELTLLRPGLPAPLVQEPEQTRAWRQRAWASFLVALSRQAPLILYLDDLQWVDDASRDCIRYLLMQHPHEPIFVIASLRTELGKMKGYIREFRTDLQKRGLLIEIALKPFSAEETHELLKTMSGMDNLPRFSRRLHMHTEGNPFFLLETIQALFNNGTLYKNEQGQWATVYDDFTKDYSELPLPESVSDLMAPHLEGLDDLTGDFLNAAAVVGSTFDPFIIQQICDLDKSHLMAAVEELVNRGIIYPERRICHFGNTLLREMVLEDINFLQLPELHENAAVVLEKSFGNSPSPSEIQQLAYHFFEAGIWAPAFDYQLQAGLQSWSVFETYTARRYLETAREILDGQLQGKVAKEQMLACLKGLGDVYRHLGPFDQSLDHYQAVLKLVEENPVQFASICWRIGVVYERQSQYEQAISWLNRGIDALRVGDLNGEKLVLCRLYMQHGLINVKQGNLDEAFDWANKALIHESAQAHNLLAVLHRTRGELAVALAHCDRCIELSRESDDLINLSKGYTNRGVILVDLNRLQEAVDAYQQALELLIDTGDAYVHAMTLGNLADVLRYMGDLEAAYGYAKLALEESKILESDFDIAFAHLNLGEVLLEEGKPRKARKEHLQVGLDYLKKHEIWDLLAQAERDIAQSYLDEGLLEEAEISARKAVSAASEPLSWSDLGEAQRILGQVLCGQGNMEEGEKLLEKSVKVLEEHGSRYALAQTYLALAELLSSEVERLEEAKLALDKAINICDELGALLCIDRAQLLERVLSEQKDGNKGKE
jgi:predicted ATPase